MCVHDTEHDLKNTVFKVMVYIKYEFRFFWSSSFLLVGGWLVGGRCIWPVVRWSVVSLSVGRWSVVGGRCWLVGGFKETLFS